MTPDTASLKIERTLNATPEKVWRIFSNPLKFSEWLCTPCLGKTDKPASFDFRVGGLYEVPMLWQTGDVIQRGKFLEIVENQKLVFEFYWEGTPEYDHIGDTVVTLELEPDGDQTKFTLTHEGFTVKKAAEEHTMGWGECVDALEKTFT